MKHVIPALQLAALVFFAFLMGVRMGKHLPITVEVVNAKPNWWGYNSRTRHLTVGLGSNTNPEKNASYTFEP